MNTATPDIRPVTRIAGRTLNSSYTRYFLGRMVREPFHVLPGLLALLNGYWHRLKFFFLGRRVKIGPWFRVYGKLHITGPGSVTIGSNCLVLGKTLRPVTLQTWRKEAHISISDNVGLNGTVVHCYDSIAFHEWSNVADAYIVDSSAHVLSADRRHQPIDVVPRAPVDIGRNVWISTSVVILKGVRVGENSVIGACSLVRSSIPEDTFAAGNPAKAIRSIPTTLEELLSEADSDAAKI